MSNGTYLILAALFALFIWFNFARPSSIDKIRPRIIDFLEFPLKSATRFAKGVYNLATFQNRYEQKTALLEKKIAVLTRMAVQTKELLQENERLRNLLSFKSRLSLKGIGAEVIGRDQSGWDTFVIIDKGRTSGIRPDAAVVKDEGLVGRVFEVGENTAKVMLLDNPNSKLSATVQRTREQGVLVGIGSGLCQLIYLPYDTQTRPGDIVIASEQSSLPAKGMLIGEVLKVLRDGRSLYATAIVKPSSNLFKIEEALCLE